MFAVVLDKTVDVPVELTSRVAVALGVTSYDVRASLQASTGGPSIIAVHADADEAAATARSIAQTGIIPTVIEVEPTAASLDPFVAARFELGAGEIVVHDRAGERRTIRDGDVDLLVRATSLAVSSHEERERTRSFSPSRALLTGGLINTRTRESTRTVSETTSEELVFVFPSGPTAIRFGEATVAYQGLGDALQPARAANFARLVDELRRRCPTATLDERLRRRAALTQVLGRVLRPEDNLDLAVVLVAWSLRRQDSPYRGL